MTYRESRMAKAERLRDWADSRDAKADAGFDKAREMASVIPFGQPILVDHYSAGRDRRYRDRIHSTMGRAVEDSRKADDMRARADGIEAAADRAIYSDDTDAVERLEERIAELEAQRDRIKAYNASCRKGTPDRSLLDDAQQNSLDGIARHCPYQLGKNGAYPSYTLSNLSGNIKRNRDRLAQVARQAERAAASENAGGTLIEDLPHGYCRVTFAEKPDRTVLDSLKAAGFRWGRGSWTGKRDTLPELDAAHPFPHHVCPTCGYDAGPHNGWFGDDPNCLDCRQDASRARDGWTPANSVD